MKTLRLMADYACFPLWITGSSGLKNINSDDLLLDNVLSAEIAEWSEIYAGTFDPKNPIGSGFRSLESEQDFVSLGYTIETQLAKKLEGIYKINYFDCLLQKYIEILSK